MTLFFLSEIIQEINLVENKEIKNKEQQKRKIQQWNLFSSRHKVSINRDAEMFKFSNIVLFPIFYIFFFLIFFNILYNFLDDLENIADGMSYAPDSNTLLWINK